MEVKYEIVLEYLQSGRYPVGATTNLKRAIRKKSIKFVIRDGLLFYSSGGCLKQWITTKKKQNQIIASCHSDSLGGHLERDKTRQKITSRYDYVGVVCLFLILYP